MEYSEDVIVEIVRANLGVYHEIEARDVVFRRKFDSEKRRQTTPWTMLGRKAFQQEDFDIWVKLHNKEITDSQAIEMMTDLMEKHYGQKYPLR